MYIYIYIYTYYNEAYIYNIIRYDIISHEALSIRTSWDSVQHATCGALADELRDRGCRVLRTLAAGGPPIRTISIIITIRVISIIALQDWRLRASPGLSRRRATSDVLSP